MKSQKIRFIILMIFLALMTYMGYRHQVMGGGPSGSPTVDALCPLGGLAGLYNYLAEGAWLRRLAPSALVLLVTAVVLTLALGRVFCGWICPMGALTELAQKLARLTPIKPLNVPSKVDSGLKYLKYLILVLVIGLTWHTGDLIFRTYDPWRGWMHLSAGIADDTIVAISILAFVLIMELFIERFWCRYLCPLGALFGLMQKPALNKITRDSQTCINCKKCDKCCPTGLEPSKKLRLTDADCLACGRCVDVCPTAGAIDFKLFNHKITPLKVGLIGVLVFALFLGGAKISGWWQSYQAPTGQVTAKTTEQILGWMTINDVAKMLKMKPQEVAKISELPPDMPYDVSIKSVSEDYVYQMREKLKAHLAKAPSSGKQKVEPKREEGEGGKSE